MTTIHLFILQVLHNNTAITHLPRLSGLEFIAMTGLEYAALPETLMVRECQYQVTQPGFRVSTITLVTTLLDAGAYPAEDLAKLYFRRGEVEMDWQHTKHAPLSNLTSENVVELRTTVIAELERLQGKPELLSSFIPHARVPIRLRVSSR